MALLFIGAVRMTRGGGVGWQALIGVLLVALGGSEMALPSAAELVLPILLVVFGLVLLTRDRSSWRRSPARPPAHHGVDRASEAIDDGDELVVGHDERRAEHDGVAVRAVGEARAGIEQQPGLPAGAEDRLRHAVSAREWRARLAVRDELQPDQEAAPTDLADIGMGAEAVAEQRLEPIALRGARLHEVLVLQDPEHLAGHRRAHRVMGVGEAVDVARRLAEDRLADRAGGCHEPEREVAGRAALRADEDVRSDAPVIATEPATRRPKPVMTSSTTRSTPWRRQTSVIACQ